MAAENKDNKSSARWLVPVLAVLVLVLVFTSFGCRDKNENAGGFAGRGAVSVAVAPVVSLDLRDIVTGVGTLEAVQEVKIKPEVNGKILSVNFEEGDPVEKNQVLFRIDDDKIRKKMEAQKAALAATRTRLGNIRRNHDRVASLRERNQVSEDQYDAVRTELEAVSSDLERLEAELSLTARELQDTIVRAPFEGFMSRRLVEAGTLVAAGEPLATIYEIDPLHISFFIGEKYIDRVAKGQQVSASVASRPEKVFTGEVKFISPVIDVGTRKFGIRAVIENSDNKLRPGSFASVNLVLATRPDRPVIPDQALVTTREGYIVYVVDADQGTAHIRPVDTGIRETGLVEIRQGLSEGERVVVYGHMRLEEGAPVNIDKQWEDDWPGREERPQAVTDRRASKADAEVQDKTGGQEIAGRGGN